LARIVPDGCSLALGPIATHDHAAFPDEEALLERAVPRRRREFRAGRALARQALAQAGGPAPAILRGDAGDPVWPQGFTGSISHTGDVAAAIAAPLGAWAGLGLDLEGDAALEPALHRLVCRPDERLEEPALAARGIDAAKLRFVAKEAYFKAVFPLGRRTFDFLDLRVAFAPTEDAFRVEVDDPAHPAAPPAGRGLMARFMRANGLLAAVVGVRA
jgi:4'-phosphopantetheinyl transferase EntD